MLMPKAAIHKDRALLPDKGDIWSACTVFG
jgi:hypothetical protein